MMVPPSNVVNMCYTLTTCIYEKPQTTNFPGVQSMANCCVSCKLTSSTIQQIQYRAVKKLCFWVWLIFHMKFLIDTVLFYSITIHTGY